MPKKTCGATLELEDGSTLTCGLTEHPFQVHDDDGHQWGDPALVLTEAVDL